MANKLDEWMENATVEQSKEVADHFISGYIEELQDFEVGIGFAAHMVHKFPQEPWVYWTVFSANARMHLFACRTEKLTLALERHKC